MREKSRDERTREREILIGHAHTRTHHTPATAWFRFGTTAGNPREHNVTRYTVRAVARRVRFLFSPGGPTKSRFVSESLRFRNDNNNENLVRFLCGSRERVRSRDYLLNRPVRCRKPVTRQRGYFLSGSEVFLSGGGS